MAQRIQTLLIDDFDAGEAEGTVRFGLDGAEYEVDLSAEHAGALRGALAPYVSAALTWTGLPGGSSGSTGSPTRNNTAARFTPRPARCRQVRRDGRVDNAVPLRAQVRLHASAEEAAQHFPPSTGIHEATGPDQCVLITGAYSLHDIATYPSSPCWNRPNCVAESRPSPTDSTTRPKGRQGPLCPASAEASNGLGNGSEDLS